MSLYDSDDKECDKEMYQGWYSSEDYEQQR